MLQLVRDGVDALRFVRSPREVVRALIPARWRPLRVLNDGPPPDRIKPAEVVVGDLMRLARCSAATLEQIDYPRLLADTVAKLARTSRGLHAIDPVALEPEAGRLAFWINLYNALVIHGVLSLRISRSVMEVPCFFSNVAYRVGRWTFTLDDIENGILRANAPHCVLHRRMFRPEDPRRHCALERVDPRVHMALVCGARSCPPIAAYDAARLDAQLKLAAAIYVNHGVSVDHTRRVVVASVLYRYFAADFGGNAGVRSFLALHADPPLAAELQAAFTAGYLLRYHRYDWTLNGVTAVSTTDEPSKLASSL